MRDWRQVYSAVARESDTAMLTRFIYELEDLTIKRMQELAAKPDPEESREIRFALRHVLSIKTERLGWPDPRPQQR